ncbi:helix-hairpin-helix domain-containing protein [Riemerella columbina]|uniref:helix-hairpin-helix domain-containing protein n=1 Tax=Riemerella columbina TaxID=103810 RepID=UPI000374E5BA|nr:helix-hairpin-helix domain-containing protein [Riemerella columbina]
MKPKGPQLPFKIYKKQLIGWGTIGLLILVLQIFFYFYKIYQTTEVPKVTFVTEPQETQPLNLTPFNPNELNAEDWKNLGFSEKQVQTILKYKDVVGGTFQSKAQLAKCYAISTEKFETLSPYIQLPEEHHSKSYSTYPQKEYGIKVHQAFNPDHYQVKDWMALGFSEKQAQSFIKYKNYLGGSFISKEKLKECYTLSPEHYRKLEPYLILPDKIPEHDTNYKKSNNPQFKKQRINYQPFDPNQLSLEGWQALGFSEKQAQVILKYKNYQLKGQIKTLEDLQKCFVISDEKFSELKPYIQLNPITSTKEMIKTEVPQAPKVVTDFSKVGINEITYDQLIEFGFSPKAAKSYLGFRKILGGFAKPNQIFDTYHIDKNLAHKLILTCPFDETKVKKYKLATAPEDWLKKHPYFKYYADKIIYYRISYPDDKKILKFINPKPQYLEKMKWYLQED